MADLFEEQLLECRFREIGFPVTSMHTKIVQSTVDHEQPDRDGARVESPGRKALVFSATAPFYNSVSKGRNETWGLLYPDTHRKILAAMANRTAGTLQHPSLGLLLVKAVSCESTLEAGRRNGETLSLEWKETRDEDDVLNAIFTEPSPIGSAEINAVDVDERLSLTNFGGFDPDAGKLSFEDAVRSVTSVFDKASLLSKRALAVVNRITYRIDAIQFAVVSAADPQNWQLKESLSKLRESIVKLNRAVLLGQKDVSLYIVPAPTTLANVAKKLQTIVGDIILLNPSLLGAPQIPAQTLVRYYKRAS